MSVTDIANQLRERGTGLGTLAKEKYGAAYAPMPETLSKKQATATAVLSVLPALIGMAVKGRKGAAIGFGASAKGLQLYEEKLKEAEELERRGLLQEAAMAREDAKKFESQAMNLEGQQALAEDNRAFQEKMQNQRLAVQGNMSKNLYGQVDQIEARLLSQLIPGSTPEDFIGKSGLEAKRIKELVYQGYNMSSQDYRLFLKQKDALVNQKMGVERLIAEGIEFANVPSEKVVVKMQEAQKGFKDIIRFQEKLQESVQKYGLVEVLGENGLMRDADLQRLIDAVKIAKAFGAAFTEPEMNIAAGASGVNGIRNLRSALMAKFKGVGTKGMSRVLDDAIRESTNEWHSYLLSRDAWPTQEQVSPEVMKRYPAMKKYQNPDGTWKSVGNTEKYMTTIDTDIQRLEEQITSRADALKNFGVRREAAPTTTESKWTTEQLADPDFIDNMSPEEFNRLAKERGLM